MQQYWFWESADFFISTNICKIFILQTGGFFIESGALDGEFLSNTLYMERFLNWTGLLIEADKKAFRQLTNRNRKAFTSPVCLSTKPYPIQVNKVKTHVLFYLNFIVYHQN
jgi:hypothetical protein